MIQSDRAPKSKVFPPKELAREEERSDIIDPRLALAYHAEPDREGKGVGFVVHACVQGSWGGRERNDEGSERGGGKWYELRDCPSRHIMIKICDDCGSRSCSSRRKTALDVHTCVVHVGHFTPFFLANVSSLSRTHTRVAKTNDVS